MLNWSLRAILWQRANNLNIISAQYFWYKSCMSVYNTYICMLYTYTYIYRYMSVSIQYIYIFKHLSILSLSLSIIKHDLACKLSTTYLWWTKWRSYSIIQCLPVNDTSAGNSVSKSCLSRCWGGRKKLKTMRENEKKRNNLLIINTVTEKPSI